MSTFLTNLLDTYGDFCVDLENTGSFDSLEERCSEDIELIRTLLKKPPRKRLLYHAFIVELCKYREDLQTENSRDLLGQALAWFAATYRDNAADAPDDLVCRIALFTACKSVLAAVSEPWALALPIDSLRHQISGILELEPVIDMARCSLIDIGKWLQENEADAIERFGRKAYHGMQDENVDGVIESYNFSLIDAPFVTPSRQQSALLEVKFDNPHRSIDLYAVLLCHMERLVERAKGLGPNSTAVKSTEGEHALAKLEWLATFLTKQMRDHPPQSCEFLQHFGKTVKSIVNRWGHNPFTVTYDVLSLLLHETKEATNAIDSKFRSAEGPMMPVTGEDVSALEKFILRKREPQGTPQTSASAESVATTPVPPVKEGEYFAFLSGIWLQVDCVVDRLVMRHPVAAEESTLMEQTLQSVAAGAFSLTNSFIHWSGVAKDAEDRQRIDNDPALCIRYEDVLRFAISSASQKGESHHESPSHGLPPIFYLTIHANDDCYKFYPFYKDEVAPLKDIMTTMTGLSPFKESDFIMETLGRKLDVTRREGLIQLLSQNSPWIEHSGDLLNVVENITNDIQPQSVYEVERLYHSCRTEPEVTKEAIYNLRRAWHQAQSENVRLKVLSVVDRLLDKAVMRNGDTNFQNMYNWLKHLEETVSPYKSVDALKLIVKLSRRAQAMQLEPLTPLIHNQLRANFQDWDRYSLLKEFFQKQKLAARAFAECSEGLQMVG